MAANESPQGPIDWSLTTWEGARREQARRWSKMSLADMILALEEMQTLAERLSQAAAQARPAKTR
ncbi:MAG TPA: hypothetical protein VGL55_02640 [Steroidobacteraceae bacterium]|jgi:hypothetical protein